MKSKRDAHASGPSLSTPAQDEQRSVVVSALVFAGGTLLSRVLGLFRDMMIARYFSDDLRDAFLNAFRLPNLFRRILGEGSISVSFIPVFVDILSGRGRRASDTAQTETEAEARARNLATGIFSILLTVTVTVSVLAILFMDDILYLFLNGSVYMSVPGKFDLTVKLGRVMFGFLILISLYGFFMAMLNALKKFALTAIAPCFFNLTVIAGALLSPRSVVPEFVLAWAVVLGGFVQMMVLVPALMRSGYFPRLTLRWNQPEVMRVLKAVGPSMFGLSILQISALVNMRFAADLESGSHSYLYLADRILELPLSLFVVSIGSVLLPTLAKFWAENDRDGMGETINHYIRLIVFVALPAAIGMFVLANSITEVLFLGREFKYDDAVATASIIRIYAFLVVTSAGVRILAQGFYAIQNTWFPALAAAVALITHVLFAFALTRAFRLQGLAVASVASSLVHVLMLATAYNAWVGSLQIKVFFRSFGKFIVCGAVMAATLQAYPSIHRLIAGRFWGSRAFALGLAVTVGALVYMACAHLMRIHEYRETVATFRTRLAKRS